MYSIDAVIITYNQASFIEKALAGALSQRFEGDYRIIIHDDHSIDGTAEKCRRFKELYPDLIDLYLSPVNKGMNRSVADVLQKATAKYIAICEGDDYWINPQKLRMQADFLEAHPDYAICCHRVFIKKNRGRPKLDKKDMYAGNVEADFDIKMMARSGNLIATPSMLFRNKLFTSLPEWFEQSPVADYVLNMLNAQHGLIKYLPQPMAVYRQHGGGMWNGRSTLENTEGMRKVITLLLGESFPEPVKQALKEQLHKTTVAYLHALLQFDHSRFDKEFTSITGEDKQVAKALVEKLQKEVNIFHHLKIYRLFQYMRRLIK